MKDEPSSPSIRSTKPLLVTGGAGFIGCNLADRLAREGYHVVILDSLVRPGVEENLDWLLSRHRQLVSFARTDVRDADTVNDLVEDAAGVFHLAAQVAVTSSLDDPRNDVEVNLLGTFNILEAARRSLVRPPVVLASTNKVYGCLSALAVRLEDGCYRPLDREIAQHGIRESMPLSFHTPYGCSKGAADQYVLDAAATFGLRTAVLRMSCIYGPRQCGTEEQGWVAHFAASALTRRPVTIFGDGCQVRDILYVDDAVEAYIRAFRNIDAISGNAYNLGGGPANAVSLRQVIAVLEAVTASRLELQWRGWRPGDQRYFVSDTRALNSALKLPPPRPWKHGLRLLVSSLETQIELSATSAPSYVQAAS